MHAISRGELTLAVDVAVCSTFLAGAHANKEFFRRADFLKIAFSFT
jgi:hypothetical protein